MATFNLTKEYQGVWDNEKYVITGVPTYGSSVLSRVSNDNTYFIGVRLESGMLRQRLI